MGFGISRKACWKGALLALLLVGLLAGAARAETEVYEETPLPSGLEPHEPPALAALVATGKLPPLAERLPAEPRLLPTNDRRTLGKPGGQLTTLVTRTKDTRLLVVYGYARLVAYNEKFDLVPDILKKVEVEDGRTFTLHLREGHKWSDGEPFTAEDFRYFWEDVALNAELQPSGPPVPLTLGGELPTFRVVDKTTVRYSWTRPNPFFLSSLAAATPLFIYRPAHYLKRYHKKYADDAKLEAEAKAAGKSSWAALHNAMDNLYGFDNPALPTLQPWRNTVEPPSTRFIAERNPYYHGIDVSGLQLPYLDKVVLQVVASALVPAKTGSGESDLQARSIAFSDYTFLKSAEDSSGYMVRLWKTVRGSQTALYPNLNANDPVWRKLNRDPRFRRALSLAINRAEINQAIYFGLGLEGANTVLPDSPLFEPEYRETWSGFDLEQANALLDEIGLTNRGSDGIRLLPDGRPLEIVIETAGENPEEVDILELISDTWHKAGIKLFTKPSQREVLRNRVFAGDTVMAAWFGCENGVPTAEMSPEEFVPVRQQSYHWPKWGQHYETHGKSGEAVDMEVGKELMQLYEDWSLATNRAKQREIWARILEINAEQVFTIGIVAQIPQPVVVSRKVNNVPEEAIFNWDPGAQFGIYRPEGFWLEQ